MSGDRGNELADIRARWSASHDRAAYDYTDAGCRVLAEHAFKDVPALLSRLDTLEAGLRWRLSPDWLDRAEAAEAQVEALTEALRLWVAFDELPLPLQEANHDAWDDAITATREALSRVSRSEPAPPNEHQGANSANYAEIRARAEHVLEPETVPSSVSSSALVYDVLALLKRAYNADYTCDHCGQPLTEVTVKVMGVCPKHPITPVICGVGDCWCASDEEQQ